MRESMAEGDSAGGRLVQPSGPNRATPRGPIDPRKPGLWKRLNWQSEIERRGIAAVVDDAIEITKRFPWFFPDAGAFPVEVLFHEDAQALRDIHARLDTWERAVCDQKLAALLTPQLLREFVGKLERSASDSALRVWERALEQSPHRTWLAAHTPARITEELERRRHEVFFQAVRAVPDFNPVSLTTFSVDEAYGSDALSEADWRLAQEWAKGAQNADYELAKMISARAAEKAAKRFYERLGHAVRDVSIEQLSQPFGGAWETHDLEVDGRPVDVKNSRPPRTGSGYSEHTVKRLKNDRHGRPVALVGVRSPYLRREHLNEVGNIPSYWHDTFVQVLGETTRAQLEDLRRTFTSDTLHDLGIDCGRGIQEYLPPWVFDYPAEFYEQEPARRYRTAVDEILRQEPPPWDLLRRNNLQRARTYYLQTGTPLPATWREALRPWETRLVDRIIGSDARRSLPHLFLTLLTDFLSAVRERREDYEPTAYLDLIFGDLTGFRMMLPLGIYDPRRSVLDLITTLGMLWRYRDRSRLLEFTRFRFTAAGLLRGTREDRPRHVVSLLAWCGERGCNVSDLVNGRDEECLCGYLICRECGYCQAGCPEMERRLRPPRRARPGVGGPA